MPVHGASSTGARLTGIFYPAEGSGNPDEGPELQMHREHAPIAVVIVSYETPELLAGCLASLRASGVPVAITVVDNSPSDSCADVVRRQSPDVRLVRPGNIGYGAAADLGAQGSVHPYVVILNADTEVTPGALEALVAAFDEDPNLGLVGPQLVDPTGAPQASVADDPTPLRVLLHETGAWRLVPVARWRSRVAPFREGHPGDDVPWVLGAALAVRREAFDVVGGFDPSFFMYFEEVDLCRRLRAAGWRVAWCPQAVVRHVGGASTSTQPVAMRRSLYRSLGLYTQRHGRRGQRTGLRLVVVTIAIVRGVVDALRALAAHDAQARRVAGRGWTMVAWDALRGWPS